MFFIKKTILIGKIIDLHSTDLSITVLIITWGASFSTSMTMILIFKTPPFRKEFLRTKFVELDKDNSNTLSADEVVVMIKEECVVDDNMARCLVDDFDLNNDGQLNKEEFNNLMITLFEDKETAEEEVVE